MKKISQKPKNVYLDYAGAAPTDPEIAQKISLYQKRFFANPSAIHKEGLEAKKIINEARTKIASLINVHDDEIIFTSSGTESDALAILGIIQAKQENHFFRSSDEGDGSGARPFKNVFSTLSVPHIITTNIEHPAVLENCKMLEKKKLAEVTYVKVEPNGIVDPKKIREAIKSNTVLVSVMYVNNEIGTIQPIREIAKEIRHHRKTKQGKQNDFFRSSDEGDGSGARPFKNHFVFPVFHTDACQAMNYLETDNMDRLGVDLLSFNSSKIYGPKGIGILYKRRGINLSPIYEGGGQEFGLRSGTENVSAIAGLAMALEKTFKIKNKETTRLIKLRDYAIQKLLELTEKTGYKIILNGDKEIRLPNNINISIPDISSELLVIELDASRIQVSEKSACHSENEEVSYVLRAIREQSCEKINEEEGSIRISLGRQTQKKDIDYLISSLTKILDKYKKWK